ncbi:MAG: DNA gyrase inhibitor YacG [Caldimonas sp.]
MTQAKVKPHVVRCPTCGSEGLYATTNPFRPFCSARCKSNDLGAWASENYRVESEKTPADLDDPEDASPPAT